MAVEIGLRRKENKLRVHENKVLKRICGLKREKITG
jgi:hypothetical protein